MYCGVPATTPDWVRLASSAARARPKSVSLTRAGLPSRRMLAGLTSRWTIPRACAAASPRAVAMATRRTSASGRGPALSRASRDGPATYGITRKGSPLTSPTAWMATTQSSLMPAAARASRRNRCRAEARPASGGAITLTATTRPSVGSNALSTTPMPPRPTTASTSYSPSRPSAPGRRGGSRKSRASSPGASGCVSDVCVSPVSRARASRSAGSGGGPGTRRRGTLAQDVLLATSPCKESWQRGQRSRWAASGPSPAGGRVPSSRARRAAASGQEVGALTGGLLAAQSPRACRTSSLRRAMTRLLAR
jgi:hypothetical protein